MNGILAIVILTLTSTSAAPTPQGFDPLAYHTHSLYPSYDFQPQFLSAYPYPNLFPQPAYVQPSLPVSPQRPLNSTELAKIEAVYQATVEKIRKQNERVGVTLGQAEKINLKPIDTTPQNTISTVTPFVDPGKLSSGVDCAEGVTPKANDFLSLPSYSQNFASPVFGPEIGGNYEIHYSSPDFPSALPYFSSYPSLSAQPAAFSTYSDFSAYAGYPVFGGSNPFVGSGSALTPSNGITNEGLPISSSKPGTPTVNPTVGGVTSDSTVEPDELKTSSTTELNETSNDNDPVGSPPSIDGPGKLSKKKRRQGKNTKKT